MIKKDSLLILKEWDLFQSYGQFNLYFEAVIASYKELLIELVKRYYGFIDFEEPETQEPYNEERQDRLLKYILSNDGASGILEKCRVCFAEMTDKETVSMMKDNEVEPLTISEPDCKFAELLFKKTKELITLRNVIIHTHYEMVIHEIFPITTLKGKRDSKSEKGYQEKRHEFTE
ncbi:MAG: hypothetical protein IPJ79_15620 [Bacteroidetes bacterium]|nr:hypothetical protein [Bacteroidota bacterium]